MASRRVIHRACASARSRLYRPSSSTRQVSLNIDNFSPSLHPAFSRHFLSSKVEKSEGRDKNDTEEEGVSDAKVLFEGDGDYEKEGGNTRQHSDEGIDVSKFTHEVKIRMPDIGDEHEGKVERWYKKQGEIIKRDDAICDIQTESFTFGMVTDDEGDAVMGEILVPANSGPVSEGEVLCTILHEEDAGSGEPEGK